MGALHLDDKNFDAEIKSGTPVLVDFWAEWCGPCKTMAPVLHEVKKDMGNDLTIIKIDVDKNPQASAAYQVSGIPTLILFRQGKVLWRQSGAMPAAQLKQVLKHNLTQ